jgi:hypothetical protein
MCGSLSRPSYIGNNLDMLGCQASDRYLIISSYIPLVF